MAYNTKSIVTDISSNPIAQYYNKDIDRYEPLEGSGGGNKVVLFNKDGTENIGVSLIPILDKLSQLTGTVIDEKTRKDNELLRIAFYNQLQQMLLNGELKGDKGDIGLGLEFNWEGTSLGVRIKGQSEYVYVNLRGAEGPQGPAGSIENLTKLHVTNALGYTPPEQDTNTTYSEITTVEIDIGTASTLRTITARRVKYILDKVVSLISALTKSDVGLGNVDNIKQMPISGGTLQNYSEVAIISTVVIGTKNLDLTLGNIFSLELTGETTITISNPTVSGVSGSLTLIIKQPATPVAIIFPASIKWNGGIIPTATTASKQAIYTFFTVDGGAIWYGSQAMNEVG